jgi:hypothetical protein
MKKIIILNQGFSLSLVISVFALLVALSSLYLALGAQYTISQARQEASRNLDQLMANLDSLVNQQNMTDGQGQAVSNQDLTDEDYAAMMEKDFLARENKYNQASSSQTELKTPSEKASSSAEVDLSAIYDLAPSMILSDLINSGVIAKAWMAVYNNVTYLRIAVKGLPPLVGSNYYQGWMVKDELTGDLFSVGRLDYNPLDQTATLSISANGDGSAYRTIMITLEQPDNNPRPGQALLKGSFSPAINFRVGHESGSQPDNTMELPAGSSGLNRQQGGGLSDSSLLPVLFGNGLKQDMFDQNSSLESLLESFKGQSAAGNFGAVGSAPGLQSPFSDLLLKQLNQ